MKNISVKVVIDCIHRKMDAASMFKELVPESIRPRPIVAVVYGNGLYIRQGSSIYNGEG